MTTLQGSTNAVLFALLLVSGSLAGGPAKALPSSLLSGVPVDPEAKRLTYSLLADNMKEMSLQHPSALEELLSAGLSDSDPRVRSAAAGVFLSVTYVQPGEVGLTTEERVQARTVSRRLAAGLEKPFLQLVEDPDAQVRGVVVGAMSYWPLERDPGPAAGVVERGLRDATWRVRSRAFSSLAVVVRAGPRMLEKLLVAAQAERDNRPFALASIGRVYAVRRSSVVSAEAAMKDWKEIDAAATEWLVDALSSPTQAETVAAAEALGAMKSSASLALPALEELVRVSDKGSAIHQAATVAISEIANGPAHP